MRITNNMLVQDLLWNSNRNLASLSDKQNQMSSGKRVTRPSDDPVGITQILKYKSDIDAANQYSENVTSALGWMEVTESAMDDIKEILQRIREITVQAANGTNTAEDTQKVRTEVEQMKDEILSLGNSTIAGRYIFSGLETDKPLFNEDGTYNIDMTTERMKSKNVVSYEVYTGEVMEVGTHPISIFGLEEDTSFFNGLLSRGAVSSTEASRSMMTFDVDVTNDFEAVGEAIAIDVGGTAYDVDMTLLAQTQVDPLTKSDMITALKSASDGGTGKLSDVANIYFDTNNKLVIEAKAYGSATTMADASTSVGLTPLTNVTGVDAVSGVYTSDAVLSDTDVNDFTEVSSLVITVNGKQENLEIDFSTLTTVADLVTEVQTQLDGKFPPAGSIVVGGADGTNLTLTMTGETNGSINTLDVDYIATQESKMISDLNKIMDALEVMDHETLNGMLDNLDEHLDTVLTAMGDIGGKTHRTEFINARIDENIITFTKLLSNVQDIDMAEAIMLFKNLENVYKASLSVGSRVIQPSLVDFIS